MPEYLTLQPNESKLIGRITNYKTNLIIFHSKENTDSLHYICYKKGYGKVIFRAAYYDGKKIQEEEFIVVANMSIKQALKLCKDYNFPNILIKRKDYCKELNNFGIQLGNIKKTDLDTIIEYAKSKHTSKTLVYLAERMSNSFAKAVLFKKYEYRYIWKNEKFFK